MASEGDSSHPVKMGDNKYMSLSLSIRVLSIILFLFTPIFFLTLLALGNPDNSLLQVLKPDIRGEYKWDFELMFATIYFIWAIFLWKASSNPQKHMLFIDFSIWTNVAHGVVMILIGILREGELVHLLLDSLVLILPAFLILIFRKKISAK